MARMEWYLIPELLDVLAVGINFSDPGSLELKTFRIQTHRTRGPYIAHWESSSVIKFI
jgi:hypothetical protein